MPTAKCIEHKVSKDNNYIKDTNKAIIQIVLNNNTDLDYPVFWPFGLFSLNEF